MSRNSAAAVAFLVLIVLAVFVGYWLAQISGRA